MPLHDDFRVKSVTDGIFRDIYRLFHGILAARERTITLAVSLDHPSSVSERNVISHAHHGT